MPKRKSAFPQLQLVSKQKRSKPVSKEAIKRAVLSAKETKTGATEFLEQGLVNNANPLYFNFPTIQNGSAINQRIGNKITAVNLRAAISMHNNGTAVGSQMYVRMLLLRVDEGRYRLNTDITNFFFEAATDVTFAASIADVLREANKEGVHVMWDRVVPLGLNVVSTGIENVKHIKKNWKLNQEMIFRDDQTADATNVRYTLVAFARDGANDGAAVTVEFSTIVRMDYKDL